MAVPALMKYRHRRTGPTVFLALILFVIGMRSWNSGRQQLDSTSLQLLAGSSSHDDGSTSAVKQQQQQDTTSTTVLTTSSKTVSTTRDSKNNGNTVVVDEEVDEGCESGVLYRGPAGLPALKSRSHLGALLEARKLTDGAEVGVQRGGHANTLLSNWKSCQTFKLIDLWAHQENYKDFANVGNRKQESMYKQTQNRLRAFKDKTEYFRMLSVEAAKKIQDKSLDFVYVDARHDYCGVMEDLQAYYPKLRPGGIMAGHDYMDVLDVKKATPEQDWSVCMDGTVHAGAVKGAVEDFAKQHSLVISVMYDEKATFASWMVQKPTKMECVKAMGEFGTQVVTK